MARSDTQGVTVSVTPDRPLFGEEVAITVEGLESSTEVVVEARMPLERGIYESWARFEADEEGRVDLTEQAPLDGTYKSLDPMGLFWSMSLVKEQDMTDGADERITSTVAYLTVTSGGQTIASTEFERQIVTEEVETRHVSEHGIVGRFYEPANEEPGPGVLLLGGSEGGIPNHFAAGELASRGYAVLALAYFGTDGLPGSLEKVRIEYFESAIDWLGSRPSVQRTPMGVVSWSRGSEAALLLASRIPELRTVVAYTPSHVVFQGIPEGYRRAGSAWQSNNMPLPYVSYTFSARYMLRLGFHMLLRWSIPFRSVYADGLEASDEEEIQRARIPVEDIDGDVLLITGGDDQMWPAESMAEEIVDQLQDSEETTCQHLSYDDAGHAILNPHRPVPDTLTAGSFIGGIPFAFGGTVEGTSTANADSWLKVLEHLSTGLRDRPASSTIDGMPE